MPQNNNRTPGSLPRLPRLGPQKRKPRVAGLDRLAHQIVDQLTVINLCCFKLRATLKDSGASVNADIDRLENAVTEMNVLVEILSHLEGQPTAPGVAVSPQTAAYPNARPVNVYPLFETKNSTR